MALWSLQGKKIFIIDDFGEMRNSIRNMVASYGADDVVTAANGEEAIALLSTKTFDIVLCDYNLGEGKDGQQVLEEAKHRNCLPFSTVFIMITAETTAMMVMGALEYQPDEYLSKPFSRTALQARLKKQLSKKEHLKPLSKAMAQENISRAIEICDELIAGGNRAAAELLKLKCELLIDQQEHVQAEAICDQVLAQRAVPWALFLKGKIRFEQGEFEQSKEIFEQVLKENANFIAAYDCLSECQRQLGKTNEAQQTLLNAVEISPKSVRRQRELANTAADNGDLRLSEQARRKTIKVGKNSVLRRTDDFTKLVDTQLQNDNDKEAFRTLELMNSEFKGDKQARLASTLSKGKIFQKLNNEEAARATTQEAFQLFEQAAEQIDNELAKELTEACLKLGDVERANKITVHLATNNHSDKALMDSINQMYEKAGVAQEGGKIIEGVRRQVTETNNRGVKMLEAGELDEAIELFETALEDGPNNLAININAAQAYLMKLKKQGRDPMLLKQARLCLDKTQNNAQIAGRYKVLNSTYWKIYNAKQSK